MSLKRRRTVTRFGRLGTGRGEGIGAFPQLRMVALSEAGTHAICEAALGPYTTGENVLADELLGVLGSGMLCLADRGFYSLERFQNARRTGAQLLWRVKSNMLLPREQQLGDGSYLTASRKASLASARSAQASGSASWSISSMTAPAEAPSSVTG